MYHSNARAEQPFCIICVVSVVAGLFHESKSVYVNLPALNDTVIFNSFDGHIVCSNQT